MRRGRRTTALAVVAIGVLVALTARSVAALPELGSFLLVAACAAFFLSRAGALVLAVGMAILAVAGNRDIASSPGPTGREIGTAALIFLLFAVAVLGVCVDLVVGLVWRSTRRRPPAE